MRRTIAAGTVLLVAVLSGCGAAGKGDGADGARAVANEKPAGEGATSRALAERRRSSVPPEDCVVRIEVPRKKTRRYEQFDTGTGVLLEDGRVVTAYHVVFDSPTPTEARPELRAYSWKLSRRRAVNLAAGASELIAQPEFDRVILKGTVPTAEVSGAPLATRRPRLGDRVTAYGSAGGARRVLEATVIGVSADRNWICLDTDSLKGDSGGPVFNSDGEVIGIICGDGVPFTPFRITVRQGYDPLFRGDSVGDWRPIPRGTLVNVLVGSLDG